MFFSWYGLTMLAIVSYDVIGLRLSKISQGGTAALEEGRLMMAEKLLAYSEASAATAAGLSANGFIDLYRERVAANQMRLGLSLS